MKPRIFPHRKFASAPKTTGVGGWFRRGTATVEAAVCFPVLVMVALGSIEINNQYYLRRSMVLAAFEAGRMVSEETADSQDVIDFAENILDQRGVSAYTVSLDPPSLSSLDEGDEVTVTVQIQKSANQIVPFNFGGPTMTVTNFSVR